MEVTRKSLGGKCIQMTKQKTQYLRPASLYEALSLKDQFGDKAKFLMGGTFKPTLEDQIQALIDLQDAGLDQVEFSEEGMKIGALVSLKTLGEMLALTDFQEALSVEFGLNVRNSLSLANFLAQANGRSPVLCCLLALRAEAVTLKNPEAVGLLDYLRSGDSADVVIEVIIPSGANLAFESVGRSPKDLPIVCVAAAKFAGKAVRVAVGGTAEVKSTFTIKDPEYNGRAFIEDAFADASDAWASAEYRQEVGAILLNRALQKLDCLPDDQEEK